MRDRGKTLQTILDTRLIAIIRTGREAPLTEMISALVDGGFRAVEVTATTPGALEALSDARRMAPEDVMIGCGTVLDAGTAAAAARVGVDFIVSPSLDPTVVEVAHQYGCTCIPGCLTPSEIAAAMRLGVDLIKLFPAAPFGPKYVKSILAPLPTARLVPTGGVEADTAADYLAAGAVAVGVGGSICNDRILREEGPEGVARRASALIDSVSQARGVANAG
jgi:2-dehydro-3-deoxyphosphogluconate aldolase / (4S)-4-hydroxy-2-oxoglutarate aldolase